MKLSYKLILFLIVSSIVPLSGAELLREKLGLTITLETVQLPGNENMTLVGGTYQIYTSPHWYYGISSYGAVFGNRGGFFTGGITGGFQYMIDPHWKLDISLFSGGGGGGGAPQGGGLMLRPQASIYYATALGRFGAGISHINYPNGDISSNQIFIAYQTSFSHLYLDGHTVYNVTFKEPLAGIPWRYSVLAAAYKPYGDAETRSGDTYQTTPGIIGFAAARQINGRLWGEGRVFGGVSGGIDGYAKILVGPVWDLPFSAGPITWEAAVLAGASGGGDVDTGGGLIIQPEFGARWAIDKNWGLGMRIGFLQPRNGAYQAMTLTAGLSWSAIFLEENGAPEPGYRFARSIPWRIRADVKWYRPDEDLETKSGDSYAPITLTGLSLDRWLSQQWYICGKAYAATGGDVGGYAEGFIGAGRKLHSEKNWSYEAEILLGVGGGGGMDVGDGLIAEGALQAEYSLNHEWSFIARTGIMAAIDGDFKAPVFSMACSRTLGQLMAVPEKN